MSYLELGLPLLALSLVACNPGSGNSGSNSQSEGSEGSTSESSTSESSTSETEGSETGEELGPACWLEFETGQSPLYERVFGWGAAHVAWAAGELIVGEDDQWQETELLGIIAEAWATAADQVLLRRDDDLYHWDGQELALLLSDLDFVVGGVSPAGELWLLDQPCSVNAGCNTRLFQWTGAQLEQLEGPVLGARPKALAPDSEGNLWLVDGDEVLHRGSGEGPWVVEGPVPNASGYNVDTLRSDGAGGLWLGMRDSNYHVYHRDAQGDWSSIEYDPAWSPYEVSAVEIHGEGIYLFDWQDRHLYRWDGVGELEQLGAFPSVLTIHGGPERLFAFSDSFSQSFGELDLDTLELTSLWSRPHVNVADTMSAAHIEGTYAIDARNLRRWDEGWTTLADSSLASSAGGGFRGLWAQSRERAWISEVDDEGPTRTRLWRWEDGALVALDHEISDAVAIEALWGSAGDRVFGLGTTPEDSASVWSFDGESWSEVPMPTPDYRPSKMTGSPDALYVIDEAGLPYAWDGASWSQLPTLSVNDPVSHELAWAGELFYRRFVSNAESFYSDNSVFVLDGDTWVGIDERWPGGPSRDLQPIAADGLGKLWGLEYVEGVNDPLLVRFDGEGGWARIALDPALERLANEALVAAPQGVVLQSRWLSQQYREACPL